MNGVKPCPDCDMQAEMQERYIADGFSIDDIPHIWADTLYMQKQMQEKREPREITCTTYQNAVRRTEKQVGTWIGGKA